MKNSHSQSKYRRRGKGRVTQPEQVRHLMQDDNPVECFQDAPYRVDQHKGFPFAEIARAEKDRREKNPEHENDLNPLPDATEEPVGGRQEQPQTQRKKDQKKQK